MTYDPTAVYRTAQVTTSSPAARVVLLYEGAIRFAALSVQRLEQHDLEGSHNASIRAQSIVGALRESLDLSAGDVATRLDSIYEFMIRRLAAGNLAKDPKPTREVIGPAPRAPRGMARHRRHVHDWRPPRKQPRRRQPRSRRCTGRPCPGRREMRVESMVAQQAVARPGDPSERPAHSGAALRGRAERRRPREPRRRRQPALGGC